ncbi:MAG: hypothetical protein U1E98_03170 [Moraxella osloensis]
MVVGWISSDAQTIDKPLLKYTLPATQEGKSGERRVKVDVKSEEPVSQVKPKLTCCKNLS